LLAEVAEAGLVAAGVPPTAGQRGGLRRRQRPQRVRLPPSRRDRGHQSGPTPGGFIRTMRCACRTEPSLTQG